MNDLLIKDIISNFKYLQEQDIIDSDYLEKIFFDKYLYSDEEIVESITTCIKDNDYLPPNSYMLNKESNEINKLELRDYLLYLSELKYISLNYCDEYKLKLYDRKKITCIDIEDKSKNKKDYLLLYPHYNPLLRNRNYAKYFKGVSNSLFKLLNSINDSFYLKIASGDEKVLKFIDSLNTVKLWDNLDELDRAARLRNEIIGKLLYVSVDFASNYFQYFIKKSDYIETEDFYRTLFDINLSDELLKKATNIDDKNDLVINKVIELYPYSFDMLRKNVFIKDESISSDYYKSAIENGYYFKADELNYIKSNYNINNKTNVSNYSYYMFNDISIKKIPYKDRLEFLRNTNAYYNAYLEDNNDQYLFKYLRNIDCYIRSVNYCDKDINLYTHRSFELFNKNSDYTNQDRINYINELKNKYKNITLNTTIAEELLNNYPISPKYIKDYYFNQLNQLSGMYLFLQDKYEIDIYLLNNFLSTQEDGRESIYRKKVIDFYNSNKEKVEANTIEESNQLNSILKLLPIISYKKSDYQKEKEQLNKESANIINILHNVAINDNGGKYAMNLYCLESKLISNNLIKEKGNGIKKAI